MKYEIDIEGVPEGYEPTSAKVVDTATENCVAVIALRRKVRKYDWSKTLNDVLVIGENGHIYPNDGIRPRGLYAGWQPNINGKCPVDPDASVVRVKYADRRVGSEVLAGAVCWSYGFGAATVIAYQFIRLADGVEW